jgi:hypothetical protein
MRDGGPDRAPGLTQVGMYVELLEAYGLEVFSEYIASVDLFDSLFRAPQLHGGLC